MNFIAEAKASFRPSALLIINYMESVTMAMYWTKPQEKVGPSLGRRGCIVLDTNISITRRLVCCTSHKVSFIIIFIFSILW